MILAKGGQQSTTNLIQQSNQTTAGLEVTASFAAGQPTLIDNVVSAVASIGSSSGAGVGSVSRRDQWMSSPTVGSDLRSLIMDLKNSTTTTTVLGLIDNNSNSSSNNKQGLMLPILEDKDIEYVVNVTREYPYQLATVMFGYIMPFVLIVTIITNLLVVMVLAQRHMRTPTNIVLFAMAIVDLLTLLSPSPWYFYIYTLNHPFHKSGILYPASVCIAHHIMTDVIPVFFHTSSIWLALLLAGQRYVYVCHPQTARKWCTVIMVKRFVIAIILVAFLHQLTRFFDYHITEGIMNTSEGRIKACRYGVAEWVIKWDIATYYTSYFTFRIIMVFVVPCIALITLNFLLFRALRRAELRRIRLLGTKFKLVGAQQCNHALQDDNDIECDEYDEHCTRKKHKPNKPPKDKRNATKSRDNSSFILANNNNDTNDANANANADSSNEGQQMIDGSSNRRHKKTRGFMLRSSSKLQRFCLSRHRNARGSHQTIVAAHSISTVTENDGALTDRSQQSVKKNPSDYYQASYPCSKSEQKDQKFAGRLMDQSGTIGNNENDDINEQSRIEIYPGPNSQGNNSNNISNNSSDNNNDNKYDKIDDKEDKNIDQIQCDMRPEDGLHDDANLDLSSSDDDGDGESMCPDCTSFARDEVKSGDICPRCSAFLIVPNKSGNSNDEVGKSAALEGTVMGREYEMIDLGEQNNYLSMSQCSSLTGMATHTTITNEEDDDTSNHQASIQNDCSILMPFQKNDSFENTTLDALDGTQDIEMGADCSPGWSESLAVNNDKIETTTTTTTITTTTTSTTSTTTTNNNDNNNNSNNIDRIRRQNSSTRRRRANFKQMSSISQTMDTSADGVLMSHSNNSGLTSDCVSSETKNSSMNNSQGSNAIEQVVTDNQSSGQSVPTAGGDDFLPSKQPPRGKFYSYSLSQDCQTAEEKQIDSSIDLAARRSSQPGSSMQTKPDNEVNRTEGVKTVAGNWSTNKMDEKNQNKCQLNGDNLTDMCPDGTPSSLNSGTTVDDRKDEFQLDKSDLSGQSRIEKETEVFRSGSKRFAANKSENKGEKAASVDEVLNRNLGPAEQRTKLGSQGHNELHCSTGLGKSQELEYGRSLLAALTTTTTTNTTTTTTTTLCSVHTNSVASLTTANGPNQIQQLQQFPQQQQQQILEQPSQQPQQPEQSQHQQVNNVNDCNDDKKPNESGNKNVGQRIKNSSFAGSVGRRLSRGFFIRKSDRAKNQNNKNNTNVQSTTLPLTIPSGSMVGTSSASRQSTLDSNRTTLMLIVVVSVFLMVEVPVAIVTVLHVSVNLFSEFFVNIDLWMERLDYIKLFTNFLIAISYSINFSIYCSMSQRFRETFHDLFNSRNRYGLMRRSSSRYRDNSNRFARSFQANTNNFNALLPSQYTTPQTVPTNINISHQLDETCSRLETAAQSKLFDKSMDQQTTAGEPSSSKDFSSSKINFGDIGKATLGSMPTIPAAPSGLEGGESTEWNKAVNPLLKRIQKSLSTSDDLKRYINDAGLKTKTKVTQECDL